MSITIKSTDIISTALTKILRNIKESLSYEPVVQDFNKVTSFSNYIASRFFDKLQSTAVNYLRLQWSVENLKLEVIENLELDKSITDESSIEVAAFILRPLVEIYLDLKCIQLCKDKANVDYDTSCQVLYFDALCDMNNLKKSVAKEMYDCEPKYYSFFYDTLSKELNSLKQRLSKKNLPLLKSVKSKYKTILEHYGHEERLFLGFDYFTQYGLLSKKIHFSYINQSLSLSPTHYFHWSILYFVLIYEQIMKLIGKENDMLEEFKSLTEFLFEQTKKDTSQFKNGDYTFLEFGVAEVVGQRALTYDVKYYMSNIFQTDEVDRIPRFAMGTSVDKELVDKIKSKYYSEARQIYNDDNFEPFYIEMNKLVNQQGCS